MKGNVIVNADDYGVSRGVNLAVATAFKDGALNSASIIVNSPHADEAFRFAAEHPRLLAGVHLVLTRQLSVSPVAGWRDISLLAGEDGGFRHGFVGLLLLSLVGGKTFAAQAELEMRAQIDKALAMGLKPAHLDSHRHVHAIPALYKVVVKLAAAYRIPRIRVVNEDARTTWADCGVWRCLANGGLLKYAVLKTLFRWSGAASRTYFYSILHTAGLYGHNLSRIRIPLGYDRVELCSHPSVMDVDVAADDPALNEFLLKSPDRQKEFEALLDRELPERFVWSE